MQRAALKRRSPTFAIGTFLNREYAYALRQKHVPLPKIRQLVLYTITLSIPHTIFSRFLLSLWRHQLSILGIHSRLLKELYFGTNNQHLQMYPEASYRLLDDLFRSSNRPFSDHAWNTCFLVFPFPVLPIDLPEELHTKILLPIELHFPYHSLSQGSLQSLRIVCILSHVHCPWG